MKTITALFLLAATAFIFLPVQNQTVGITAALLPDGTIIDSIFVEKAKREMTVFCKGVSLKKYRIALGQQPVGHKQFEGDSKTPEGLYRINGKNPVSRFHKSLGIDYPDTKDANFARAQGMKPGGDIKIHGFPNQVPKGGNMLGDWTNGCIGITNDEIDDLYSHTRVGAKILIVP